MTDGRENLIVVLNVGIFVLRIIKLEVKRYIENIYKVLYGLFVIGVRGRVGL